MTRVKTPHPRTQRPLPVDRTSLLLHLSKPVHRRLKLAAVRLGVTIEALAVAVLEDRLSDHEDRPHE